MENFNLSWENLIGNAATTDYLKKIIAEEKFPHAVIFSGAEGVGKRLAAEICAAALLCENPTDGKPCGHCEGCRLVAAKSHPDFYVVEAEATKTTRNIKIGQIREMQSETALRPINSARRVVIIDGAELMNNAAANCLLKTIEEPPSQTIFILLTASRSSLLMTIRSNPEFCNLSSTWSRSGLSPTLTKAFGMVSVRGLSRVPNPAAKIIACLILRAIFG